MNSLIFLPLLLAAVMAAPMMSNRSSRMNNPGVYYSLQYPYLGVYGGPMSRQGVPASKIRGQQVTEAVSNLQEYTGQKFNSFLCLLDSTCRQPTISLHLSVLPPLEFGTTTTTTTTTVAPSTQTITSCTSYGNCGEMCTSVTTSSGVIQSPNFPVDYGNDLDCVIKIEGSSAVKIEFTTFNLEDTYDFIYIFDGLTPNYPLLKEATGNTIPAVITSTTKNMIIFFTSDSTNEYEPDYPRYSWQGTFTAV